jgi:ElaB/YqjD/DUF883 family membrane-anchored ribosome-binding protein
MGDDQVDEEVNRLERHADEGSGGAAENAGDLAEEMEERASSAWDEAKEKASHARDDAREQHGTDDQQAS